MRRSARLDYRWYSGYALSEPVPDHSSLSKIREHHGLKTFQRYFKHVVASCIEAGLVWGKVNIEGLSETKRPA